MPSDGQSSGFYVPEGSDLLDRFDARFDDGERSEHIRNALELYLLVDEALEEVPWEFSSEQDKRRWIRQACLDLAQREVADEV